MYAENKKMFFSSNQSIKVLVYSTSFYIDFSPLRRFVRFRGFFKNTISWSWLSSWFLYPYTYKKGPHVWHQRRGKVFLVLHAVSFIRSCVNFPHRNHRLPRRCPRRSYHKSHCPRRNRRRHLLPFHLRAYYRASFLRADQRHLWIERLKSEGRRRRR